MTEEPSRKSAKDPTADANSRRRSFAVGFKRPEPQSSYRQSEVAFFVLVQQEAVEMADIVLVTEKIIVGRRRLRFD